MYRVAVVCLLSVGTLGVLGCGRPKEKPVAVEDDFGATDKEDQREAREIARMEKLEKERSEAEEKSERDAERAEAQREKRRESDEQKRRAALCPELLGDLRADLKVTPSASVKKLLGSNFSVELRGGPNPIDLDRLGKAIASKKWLEVLGILQKTRVMEYPDEVALDGVRREFLNHQFLAFVKTPIDVSRIHLVSLSEDKPKQDTLGAAITSCDYIYVNGKPVRSYGGGISGLGSHFRWERHPDGSGWFFTWRPIDGEIILVPNLGELIRNEVGGLKRLHEDAAMKALEKYGPVPTGFIAGLRREVAPSALADFLPSEPEISESRILGELSRIGPVLWSMADGRDVKPGSKVPDGIVPGRLEEVGLVPTLEKKFKLGEVTARQISDALDKACLERFQARRMAALAM